MRDCALHLHSECLDMSYSFPVIVLVFLGTIIAFLGFIAAGNIPLVALGLLSIFGAGVLQVAGARRA